MTALSDSNAAPIAHPPGFRARRGLNWASLGLLYTTFYMCRYNLSIANKSISQEFGFTRTEMGYIITTALFAYACGQIINGLLTDRLGGKRAMLIGATGTVVMNVVFGAASFEGLLGLFVAIRGLDGYLQAFGAPGMVKINAAWFARRERGRFSGIFGFVINLGRFGIFNLGPALLAGFSVFGMVSIPPLHWRWLFWAPSIVCATVAVFMACTVAETPEQAGYAGVIPDDSDADASGVNSQVRQVIRKIAGNPVLWITASAYACTGAVRQAVDQWFPRYMQESYQVDLNSASFKLLAFLIPFIASAGSLTSGYASDILFKGRRAPVAAILYFAETAIILLAAQFHSSTAAIVSLVLISFTANSTHSILGSAAPMDIGGRKMAGFALGLIDSFQYFGGSLAGYFLGRLLDKSLGNYFYFMAPFGFIGGMLMLFIKDESKASQPRRLAVSSPAHRPKSLLWIGLTLPLFAGRLFAADSDHCAVCGEMPFGSVYRITDAVTGEKVTVCTNCEAIYPNCFLCGLPAQTNAPGFVRLPDDRSICARDAQTALLQDDESLRICREVRDELDRLFSRFMTFPETNVSLGMVDRVHLQELFKFAGNDYHCPNVWGYTCSRTNHDHLEHQISLLRGLLPAWFRATCAHEYTHTWVHQHVSPHRRDTLGRDAEEGFCELVAYLLMDAHQDEAQKAMILRNAYTRGQVDCFIAARNQYGFNDVLDWILHGEDDQLSPDDPTRVHRLESPTRQTTSYSGVNGGSAAPAPAATNLVLKAVFWSEKAPVALINDHSFSPREQAKVRLGSTNVTIQCLSIRPDAVTIRVAGALNDQVLLLKRP